MRLIIVFFVLCVFISACSKSNGNNPAVPPVDSGFVNQAHLDHLYVPVVFADGTPAAGIFIYSQYPDYHLVEATGEGFTCVDDVSRAALFYMRKPGLESDTANQRKLFNLVEFMLKMQAPSGYFYNFLQTGSSINTTGSTSAAGANWWSWRALQSLSEAYPLINRLNTTLAQKIRTAIESLVQAIKLDLIPLPETTETVNGITIPQWLPAGSGTDQAATLMLGLMNYTKQNPDSVLFSFVRKLADGMVLMQLGDSSTYPFGMILSWQNQWHAYGGDQALALLQAGNYLQDTMYSNRGLKSIDLYFNWLLRNNYKSSIALSEENGVVKQESGDNYDQIAYGFRPMIAASAAAYELTGKPGYADLAGQLAAWFLGTNDAAARIYDPLTGICFDAISTGNVVNKNSGAESTIEALLSFQIVEANPAIRTALAKYNK